MSTDETSHDRLQKSSDDKSNDSNYTSSSSIFHRGQDAVDCLDIRLNLHWKNDIPELPSPPLRSRHAAVVIPSDNQTNGRLAVLGGINQTASTYNVGHRSVLSLHFRGTAQQQNPSWCHLSLPDMNEKRKNFGVVCVGEKLYAIGGSSSGTIEVLDLDNVLSGWAIRQTSFGYMPYCAAVPFDNRYIFVAFSDCDENICLVSYDTYSSTWNKALKNPRKNRRGGFGFASICVPGEGSYVVLVGGSCGPYDHDDNYSIHPVFSVEAYHVESNKWIQLPDLPNKTSGRAYSTVSSLGNRFLLVAGGYSSAANSENSSVIAFDWKEKKWFELPSLPEARSHGAGAIVAGTVNKWIITGGSGPGIRPCPPTSLEIAPGIGWAKERLLLLCFQKKAQKDKAKVKGPCLLEGLDAGVFANILLYLFVPFQSEIECKGSIFTGMLMDSSLSQSGKRKGFVTSKYQASKKARKSS